MTAVYRRWSRNCYCWQTSLPGPSNGRDMRYQNLVRAIDEYMSTRTFEHDIPPLLCCRRGRHVLVEVDEDGYVAEIDLNV